MIEETLKNPPIVEALVEIRWELKEKTSGGHVDPHYQFLLGTFRKSIEREYPFHEALPTSEVPDEITGGIVKHRFRVEKDAWPLVQIGPGVVTVNIAENYGTFENFKPKAVNVVKALFESHPEPRDLKIKSLMFRYIDAVEFDYSANDVCEFLSNSMNVESKIPEFLLIPEKIEKLPVGYSVENSFRCNNPPGVASLRIDTGHKSKKRAIIWNQILKSSGEDVPDDMPTGFENWISEAHEVIYTWFESIIKGKLKDEFNRG
ncbi:MAG: TIGR04255 family protein [Phycisphaerae bacterium]|nr:TIGR04255 family protein [Phycisphaerae bacterium]